MDLDELDRKCAEARGWIEYRGSTFPPGATVGKDASYALPSPTRSWEDFGALLLWIGGQRVSYLQREVSEWQAAIAESEMDTYHEGKHADPRVALCMAVAAWKESSHA